MADPQPFSPSAPNLTRGESGLPAPRVFIEANGRDGLSRHGGAARPTELRSAARQQTPRELNTPYGVRMAPPVF